MHQACNTHLSVQVSTDAIAEAAARITNEETAASQSAVLIGLYMCQSNSAYSCCFVCPAYHTDRTRCATSERLAGMFSALN